MDFKPEGTWAVEAAPATEEEEEDGVRIKENKWEEVELEGFEESNGGRGGCGGEWFEYDEKNEREVSIKVIKWEIRR